MGDVVGRGIEAAARMAHLQSAVRAYALEGLRLSLVLERMNGFVEELEKRCTATLLLAIVDPDAETVRLASAGHPPPLIVNGEGEPTFAEGPPGNPLGATHFPSYEETVLALLAGSAWCSTRTGWPGARSLARPGDGDPERGRPSSCRTIPTKPAAGCSTARSPTGTRTTTSPSSSASTPHPRRST